MDVAIYRARTYPNPPCWAFVADVYQTELDLPVTDYRTINSDIRALASKFRLEIHKGADGFSQIPEPIDFAVVLLGSLVSVGVHHCGIYWKGSVLHALPDGIVYQDMGSLRDSYKVMQFWARPETIAGAGVAA